MNSIHFSDTHVYPGCSAIFFFKISGENVVVPALAEFADGAIVNAHVTQVNAGELLVDIDSYTTARGSQIPKKSWCIRYDDILDIWKVVAKVQ